MDSRLMNEKGMSLVTTLLAVVIIVVALPLLSFVLNKLTEPKLYEDIKFEQFFHFIRDDALRSNDVRAVKNTLIFDVRNGDTATLSMYKDNIRRQVGGVGHEIYLRDVKLFEVTQQTYSIDVKIKSTTGGVYAKTIPLY